MNDRRFLRRKTTPPALDRPRGVVRVADLFSGCGGMTLGLYEAARRTGLLMEVVLALDLDPDAVAVYDSNLGHAIAGRIEDYFDGETGSARLTPRERHVRRRCGTVDVLVGGPPCQGNSDLNNHTRRDDPRNRLYVRMARAARVLRPSFVVVENVPAVVHDLGGAADLTRECLEQLGYSTWAGILDLGLLGVPQRRSRHFLLASSDETVPASQIIGLLRPSIKQRSVRWAISDLVEANGTPFDATGAVSPQNQERISWLFENDEFVLPNELRPPCHRLKPHSYKSVYGRMRWDDPAPTITTGFGSMGQGCFIHPAHRRTITPHEAARLQTFPDFFSFSAVSRRSSWARLIGNAVPPLAIVRLLSPVCEHLANASDGDVSPAPEASLLQAPRSG